MTASEIKGGEAIMALGGRCDSKHKLNLADADVPQSVLDKIEDGCSLETLEEIAKGFPICRYATQITIHGRFPEISKRRVGGVYVNLVRNKNGSVGVRWNAIDAEKRRRLYSDCRLAGWRVAMNSSDHFLFKSMRVTKENYEQVKAQMTAEVLRIDRSLFFGDASVRVVSIWGVLEMVAAVRVCAFYEKDYARLAEQIAGIPMAEIDRLREEERKRREFDERERERRWAEYKESKARKDAEVRVENEKWMADNPAPFPLVRGHVLKAGEVVAEIRKDAYGKYLEWRYFVVGKSFGRLTLAASDAHGVKVKGAVGRAVRNPTADRYVKVA